MNRRDFLRLGAGIGIAGVMGSCSAQSLPLSKMQEGRQGEPLFAGLARSLPEEFDYEAECAGKIPVALRGSLYRNGAGLFERGGLRKRALMDGDGMVRAFYFHDRGVRFKNRFVRTEKYVEESAARRYIYPTFSTQAPGGLLANIWPGSRIKCQAQISVVVRNGRLYAFDESFWPYELHPETLETIGETGLGLSRGEGLFSAHSKIDIATGEWLHFGLHYGKKIDLHMVVHDSMGRLKRHGSILLPRYVYMHDYFVSGSYLIFNLQPLEIDLFSFLFGMRSISDAMSWRPEQGSLIMIVDRNVLRETLFIETEAAFMWHSLNAYERDGCIVADFIGYRTPDHFISDDAPVHAVMAGKEGHYGSVGELRRYVIDIDKKRIRQEVLHGGSLEWPTVNPFHRCRPHRYGYAAITRGNDFFWTGVARIDTITGKCLDYYFDKGIYCGEPVFVPEPGCCLEGLPEQEPGWLLAEAYDGYKGKSFLAVFQADRITDGPVAVINLRHHLPFSMHGFWQARL